MEREVGATAWFGKLLGPKIKGNSYIIYLLPATSTRHDRPLKTGGFDGNEISFSGVLCPASAPRTCHATCQRDTRG